MLLGGFCVMMMERLRYVCDCSRLLTRFIQLGACSITKIKARIRRRAIHVFGHGPRGAQLDASCLVVKQDVFVQQDMANCNSCNCSDYSTFQQRMSETSGPLAAIEDRLLCSW